MCSIGNDYHFFHICCLFWFLKCVLFYFVSCLIRKSQNTCFLKFNHDRIRLDSLCEVQLNFKSPVKGNNHMGTSLLETSNYTTSPWNVSFSFSVIRTNSWNSPPCTGTGIPSFQRLQAIKEMVQHHLLRSN